MKEFSQIQLTRRGLLKVGFAIASGVAVGCEPNNKLITKTSCDQIGEPKEIKYGEGVCILPGKAAVLKADFESDLEAVIINEGIPEGADIPKVRPYYIGTSPYPEPSPISFGGITWGQSSDGTVQIEYYTSELAPENHQTWSFVELVDVEKVEVEKEN